MSAHSGKQGAQFEIV